jgi:hypothetical protein
LTPSQLLALVIAWGGVPAAPAAPLRGDPYLGVIEKVSGEPTRVRVAFKRTPAGDWLPALGEPSNLEALKAAPSGLPAQIQWTVCLDGSARGRTTSRRARYQTFDENGTQGLPSPPPFVRSSANDSRFRVFIDEPMARPVVVSTLPEACGADAVRRTSDATVAAIVGKTIAALSRGKADQARLLKSRSWQTGAWRVVDLDYRQSGGSGTRVVIAAGDEVRHDIAGARVIDWISVDGDDVPDLLLWRTGHNRDGYVLIYGSFSKRVDFSWAYH